MSNDSLPPSVRLQVERLEERTTPAPLYAVTSDNRLIRFDSETPARIESTVDYDAYQFPPYLQAYRHLVGVDFHQQSGILYGLWVYNPLQLPYGPPVNRFETRAEVAPISQPRSAIVPKIEFLVSDRPESVSASYGFGFDPVSGTFRVTSSEGLNWSVDLIGGQVTTTNPPINPVGTRADGVAFDVRVSGTVGPANTMYTLDAVAGLLQTQGGLNQTPSPDTGTQYPVGPLGVSVDPTGGLGFDIAPYGPAYAVFDADPTAGVNAGLYTIDLTTGAATLVGPVGDGSVSLRSLAAAPQNRLIVGDGAGAPGRVEVYDPFTGGLLRTFVPFPGFLGGLSVAGGDVNRDGVPDVIVGAGPGGGPNVKVFSGRDGSEVASIFAFDPRFRGGVTVASGDMNGDGFADLIVGAGPGGGPHVRAFSGRDGSELASFFAYDIFFRGGVRVAVGDFDADGIDEIVTAAGPGGGPHVRVFARDAAGSVTPYAGGGISNSFLAYAPAFTGGVWVATGDVDADGKLDVITGPDVGGAPQVKMFDGRDGAELFSFFVYETTFTGGVRVGFGSIEPGGYSYILTTPASNRLPQVQAVYFVMLYGDLRVQKEWDVLTGGSGAYLGSVL